MIIDILQDISIITAHENEYYFWSVQGVGRLFNEIVEGYRRADCLCTKAAQGGESMVGSKLKNVTIQSLFILCNILYDSFFDVSSHYHISNNIQSTYSYDE